MRQDKLFKWSETQLRWNRLPTLASSHSGPPENWTLPYSAAPAENPAPRRLAAKFSYPEKPATSWLPDQSTTLWVESISTGDTRRRGAQGSWGERRDAQSFLLGSDSR